MAAIAKINGNARAPNTDRHEGQYYNARVPSVPLVHVRSPRMH